MSTNHKAKPGSEYGPAFGAFVVVMAIGMIAVLIFVPARAGASSFGKFYLAGIALISLRWGFARLYEAWKARRLRADGHGAGDN